MISSMDVLYAMRTKRVSICLENGKCGGGEEYTRARETARRRHTRGAPNECS